MPKMISEARHLCSELVTIQWISEFGRKREVVANLEEIWALGAQLQCPGPVRPDTRLHVTTPKVKFSGVVRSCAADFVGYFVEIDFEDGYQWSKEEYEPDHCFDPRSLLKREELKAKNNELLNECCKVLSSETA